ncbi:hypothetical protein Tco_0613207 [Tanacetum coccineum]
MADLIFADSHNMVAYLEKLEDNADFAEIVDFLNASPISSKSTAWNEFGTNIASAVICLAKKQKFNFSKLIFDAIFNDEYDTPSRTKKVFANMRRQGKDFSRTMIPLFATMLIQSQAVEGEGSGQPTKPQHTPTTASPSHSSRPITLVVDKTVHKERGDSVERAATTATSLDAEQGSGGSPRRQDTIGDRPAQTRVLNLENVMNAQALEIKKLKKRVKKLESKKKSRTLQLKRRLFKGRNEIDQDEGISWFQEDSETQGRYGYDIRVNTASTLITTANINITTAEPVTTASAPVTIAGVSVSTAEPSTPPTTTTTTPIEDEDLTIAQTLMKMKISPPQIDPKDKGKAKMVESKKPKKKKDQIKYDADVAQRLQAELDSLVYRLVVAVRNACSSCLLMIYAANCLNFLNFGYGKSSSFCSFLEMKKPGLKDKEKKKLVNCNTLPKGDDDDLVMLWSLVKEKFNSTEPTDDKEREIWVELKRLFEPDTDDELWKLQKHIHDLTWRLYDSCGVHHVSTEKGIDFLHAGREGVSIVKRNSYIDASTKSLSESR